MEHKKIIGNGMVFLVTLVLSLSVVSAFAVGSTYWKGNPYGMSPGSTSTVDLYLQNNAEEDIAVMITLKAGNEIASIEEGILTVPAGADNDEFPVSLTIPEDAEIGTTHLVTVSFVEQGDPGSGQISIGRGYDVSFDVEVVEEFTPEPEVEGGSTLFVWITLIVLVILIAVVIILIRKKN